MFGDLEQQEPSELLDPKHWFIVVGAGPYMIRNLTKGQNLQGEYDTAQRAHRMIKAIASRNPRFQLRKVRP